MAALQRQGEWTTFDSVGRANPAKDPDGFRVDYPADWRLSFSSGGGTKNLGRLRLSIDTPYYWLVPRTGFSVWWSRINTKDDWTLENVQYWFEENLGFGIADSELVRKHYSWQETTIGKGHYPALEQSFERVATVFQVIRPRNSKMRVVVFVVDDEIFALTMTVNNADPETDQIFQRMLDSFEVYK